MTGSGAQFLGALGRAARGALDLVLPPLCLVCRKPVGDPGALCSACWAGIRFIGPPFCDRCGLPFEHPQQRIGEASLHSQVDCGG